MQDIKTFRPSDLNHSIAVIIGTRPSIVMFAPIIKELQKQALPHIVIHTGQHYSPNMDRCLFQDLALKEPEYRLHDISQYKTHGTQTAHMLQGIESILLQERPRCVLVGGDANTNLAGALAARKLGIKLGHVESGERSFDWRMPEEHNRRMIDHISDYLFATGEKAKVQLKKESVVGQIIVTGNPIVDASLQHSAIAKEKSRIFEKLTLQKNKFILFTAHREENVDVKDHLQGILHGVAKAQEKLNLPVLFSAHPRTLKRMKEFQLDTVFNSHPDITTIDAVGYLDFMCLLTHATLVITDSGGVQQEACIHQIPAVTVRENTEWTETLDIHANRLAGTNPTNIAQACVDAVAVNVNWPIPFGDGHAAKKIVDVIAEC